MVVVVASAVVVSRVAEAAVVAAPTGVSVLKRFYLCY